MELCAIESCGNTKMKSNAWKGKFYCHEHYSQMVWDEFFMQYDKWKTGEPIHDEFKYILGRAYDEGFFKTVNKVKMLKTDISSRGVYFTKTEGGCEFETTQYFLHPKGVRETRNKINKWVVDIEAKTFTKVSTRIMNEQDFDACSQNI